MTYEPEKCDWIRRNMDPPFTVPKGGEYRTELDMSGCGGNVQNFTVYLLNQKRNQAKATLAVYDQTGKQVGTNYGHITYIGNVPDGVIYTIIATAAKSGGSETCTLAYSGAM
jgi:hypothetical protein